MKNTITILLVTCCMFSCSRNNLPQVTTVTKDSTVVKDSAILRDSVITKPGEEIVFNDSLPSFGIGVNGHVAFYTPSTDSSQRYYLYNRSVKAGNLSAHVKIDNKGRMSVLCKEDSLLFRIQWLERVISTMNYKEEVKTVTVPGPEVTRYRVPKWIWYILIPSLLGNMWQFRNPILSLLKRLLKWN